MDWQWPLTTFLSVTISLRGIFWFISLQGSLRALVKISSFSASLQIWKQLFRYVTFLHKKKSIKFPYISFRESSLLRWTVSRASEVKTLSEPFLNFWGRRRRSSREPRKRVEDFSVVSSYRSAWCPGCVGPLMFIKQGIKRWNAFRKLSDRNAYKMWLTQLKKR